MIGKYETFKQTLLQYIQHCGLDVGIIYFVMKDIFKVVEDRYYSELHKEAIEQAEAQKQAENKEAIEQAE